MGGRGECQRHLPLYQLALCSRISEQVLLDESKTYSASQPPRPLSLALTWTVSIDSGRPHRQPHPKRKDRTLIGICTVTPSHTVNQSLGESSQVLSFDAHAHLLSSLARYLRSVWKPIQLRWRYRHCQVHRNQ
jgi:hypothetical protein